MTDPNTRERELELLKKIDDNYEKVVLALECDMSFDYEGIKIQNALDFLLG